MAQAFQPLVRKPRPRHDDFDVPPLLKVELQTHRAKLRKDYDIKRLENDKAFGERLVMDYFHKPSPQVIALLQEGVKMEEMGELQQASHLFSRVLCSEPSNLELRQYVNRLVTQINEQQSQLKSERRQREMQERYGVRGEQQSLHLKEAEAREIGKGPIPRPVGVIPVSSPAQFRADLLAQAAEAKLRRQAEFAEEDRLERRQLESIREQYEAAKYQQKLDGGNAKLQYHNELLQQREDNAIERRRLYELEGNELRHASRNPPPGPLGGEKMPARLPGKKQPHDHRPMKPHKPECPQYVKPPQTYQQQSPRTPDKQLRAHNQAEQYQVAAQAYAHPPEQQQSPQQHPQQQHQQPRQTPQSPRRQAEIAQVAPQYAPTAPFAVPGFSHSPPMSSVYGSPEYYAQRGRHVPVGEARNGYPEQYPWQPVQAWSSPAGIAQAGYAHPPTFYDAPQQQHQQHMIQALPYRVDVRQQDPKTAGLGRGPDDGGVAAGMRGWVGSEIPEQAPIRKPSPYQKSPHAPFGRPGVDRPSSAPIRAADVKARQVAFATKRAARERGTPFKIL